MIPDTPYLSIVCDEEGSGAAELLSDLFRISVHGPDWPAGDEPVSQYRLRVSGERLQLEFPLDQRRKPWIAELGLRRPSCGRDPLLRAIGTRKGFVVDMTAGWCMDAALIAASGCRVMACEQNPLIYVLSRHALDHHPNTRLRSSLDLVHGDSREVLKRRKTCADVIYLDPMYPGRRKSGASPGRIMLLRELVNGNSDALDEHAGLLETALRHARRRVVVKRSRHAPPIRSGVTGEIHGKQVRFDLYTPKR